MLTASYFTYFGDGRVSISRSIPRGMVMPSYRDLAPGPWFRSVDEREYRVRYFDQLSKLDARKVWNDLHELTGGVEPVLLCFEKPPFIGDNWCHRRMAAFWFAKELGVEVPEWEQVRNRPAVVQPGLF